MCVCVSGCADKEDVACMCLIPCVVAVGGGGSVFIFTCICTSDCPKFSF